MYVAVQLNALHGQRVPNLDTSFLVVILWDKVGSRWKVTFLMTFVFQDTEATARAGDHFDSDRGGLTNRTGELLVHNSIELPYTVSSVYCKILTWDEEACQCSCRPTELKSTIYTMLSWDRRQSSIKGTQYKTRKAFRTRQFCFSNFGKLFFFRRSYIDFAMLCYCLCSTLSKYQKEIRGDNLFRQWFVTLPESEIEKTALNYPRTGIPSESHWIINILVQKSVYY